MRQCEAGILYVATNALMPGLVKVGRTQMSVCERLRQLYTSGVPCPFVAERQRFFLDCYAAEKQFLRALASIGERCMERQFFFVEPESACNLLENLYQKQHEEFRNSQEDFENFRALATDAFSLLHSNNLESLCEDAARMIEILPYEGRQLCGRSMLAYALEKKDGHLAKMLVQDCQIEPDVAIETMILPLMIRDYFLTGYESAIYFQIPAFVKYLQRIGCTLEHSKALCYVVDALVNAKLNNDANIRLVEFAVDLIRNGINPQKLLNVECFANAPRSCKAYDFRLFPRNINKSCIEVIEDLAPTNHMFSILYDRISQML